jgi:hypothetical protein
VPPGPAAADQQPGSAFRWTAQDIAGPAATVAPVASLFSSPAAVAGPAAVPGPISGDGGPPAPVRPADEVVVPSVAVSAGPPPSEQPAVAAQQRRVELVEPRFREFAAVAVGPGRLDRDLSPGQPLARRRPPRPVRFPPPDSTEIVGNDPRA